MAINPHCEQYQLDYVYPEVKSLVSQKDNCVQKVSAETNSTRSNHLERFLNHHNVNKLCIEAVQKKKKKGSRPTKKNQMLYKYNDVS